MNKDILIKNSNWLILLFLLALVGCNTAIEKSELIFKSGKYYAKLTSKPYSGKVISNFSNGELEGISTFHEGVIEKSEAFGYEGELIAESIYDRIEGVNIKNEKVERINLVSSHEGEEDYRYYSVQVIVSEELNASEYEELQSDVMSEIERLQYLDKISAENLSFRITRGELEPPLFTRDIK